MVRRFMELHVLSGKNKTASRSHSSGRNHDHSRCPLELSFATCASLDDEQMLVRCSSRIRQPFVRLRDPDCPKAHRRRSGRGEATIYPDDRRRCLSTYRRTNFNQTRLPPHRSRCGVRETIRIQAQTNPRPHPPWPPRK